MLLQLRPFFWRLLSVDIVSPQNSERTSPLPTNRFGKWFHTYSGKAAWRRPPGCRTANTTAAAAQSNCHAHDRAPVPMFRPPAAGRRLGLLGVLAAQSVGMSSLDAGRPTEVRMPQWAARARRRTRYRRVVRQHCGDRYATTEATIPFGEHAAHEAFVGVADHPQWGAPRYGAFASAVN